MQPGDKVIITNTEPQLKGVIMRPSAPDVNDSFVVKIDNGTEIVVRDSFLETV